MGIIIAFANQKGGVAKTTSVMTLGYALTMKDKKVLLVDIDPQGSLTLYMGHNSNILEKTIYQVLINDISIKDVLISGENCPDLIPSNIELSAAEIELMAAIERERILKDVLEDIKSEYDYILLDCPPSLGILTINALVAAEYVIIPLKTDYLSMKGVNLLLKTISRVQQRPNRDLNILGILPTMYDQRTTHNREVLQETQKAFDGTFKVFDPVYKSVRFEEAPTGGRSIFDYSPETPGAKAYLELAKELLKYEKKKSTIS
jgi:chromosome partitioning protein